MTDKLYTIQQAADYLGVKRNSLYRWMRSGKIDWVWVGESRRITESELQKFIRPASASVENTEKNLKPVIAA